MEIEAAAVPAIKAAAAPLARRCVQEFAAAWDRGERPRAAVWLEEHAELASDMSFVLDLAYEEYCQRIEKEGGVDTQEFCEQFPKYQVAVAKLISVHGALGLNDAQLSPSMPWPKPGEELLGFRLRETLGCGTFSRVFLAEDVQLKRQVVVKVCRDGQNEATTLARLDHPHIVPIHSAPSDPFLGFTAICLPYQGRVTLAHAISQLKQMPRDKRHSGTIAKIAAPQALRGPQKQSRQWWGAQSLETAIIRLGMQLADGLAHAHAAGIVHRDLKPSNILLALDGSALLMDFNLAADQQLTPRLGGTLPYMAPEQLSSLISEKPAKPNPRSDLFALGAVLYELATGRYPFGEIVGASDIQELARVAGELRERQITGPPPMATRGSGLTRRFEMIVRRCLAFEPSERFNTAADLRAALTRELRPIGRLLRWSQRRPLTASLAGCALLGATAAASWGAYQAPLIIPNETELGRSAIARADYAVAEQHLMAAVLLRENDGDLRRLLGIARMKQGKYEWALQDFFKLEQIAPEQVPWELAGYCCLKLKMGANIGVQLLENVRAPLTPESQNNLGYCLLQMRGRQDEAKDLLDHAVAFLPDRQAPYVNRIHWAWVASTDKPIDQEQLQADIDRALAIGPDCKELRFIIALALSHPTRREEISPALALAHLRQALQMGLDKDRIMNDAVLGPLYRDAALDVLPRLETVPAVQFDTLLEPPAPNSPPSAEE